ncbi:HAMP domain-containing sensor histidine kinase [Streptomyces sp. sk2.1]|uniref:sensor histidine kinase n=1 Tax=Streptomyces sp. sk2.1 TaxID=2478959 RepID=UPI0011E64993|nr:HAMP domain-containing sensor histidine kinase [Streptomyces sp. sk2.1]TXS80550.1 sensor histidine kinase [Streptomyces sp. sk2.1]
MNRARLRLPSPQRLPLRGRLTLVTTAVFAVLGCGLLLLNWLSSRQLLEAYRDLVVPAATTDTAMTEAGPPMPGSSAAPAEDAEPPETPGSTAAEAVDPAQAFSDFQDSVLGGLLLRSLLMLVAFTVLAAALAWWAGRRSLRRLSQVTAAAQRISTGNTLDERLGLTGPHDEVRELGDTFDAMLDRLDHSFTAQRRFTAHASHELRTPLTLQRTALEIPLAQGRVPTDLKPAVQRALDANARTEQLIAALLTLARGEAEAPVPQPADLADAARDALADLADEARTAGIRIAGTPEPAPVAGDPALLRQIALNLLSNAVRHNHRDGTASVATGTTDAAAYIEVANTGPVLTPDEIPSLFEAFHRGQEHRGNGSGLGLAVVRTITVTHRGRVTAVPRNGGGLTVRVELPRHSRKVGA